MKIFIIPSGFDFSKKSNTGGIRHVLEVASNLAINNEVVIIVFASGHIGFSTENFSKLKIIHIKYFKNFILRILCKYLFFPLSLSHLFLKENPDIVYNRLASLTLQSLMIAKFTRKKYVVEVNGLKIDELRINKKQSIIVNLQIELVKILEKITYKCCDKIICVTDGIKNEIHRMYKIPLSKIEVIPNGTNTKLFRPIKKAKDILNLDKSYKYIGFVGSLSRWQGIEYLINAAPEIIKKEPRVKFLIIGDGVIRKELEKMVKISELENYFTFFGLVEYKKVPLYINAFDVCVAPWIRARNEKIGLSPLKLFTYLACGKAVVAGDVKGVREIFVENNLGETVDPVKKKDLSNAILNLLHNEKLRDEIGKRGRKLVVNNHSWEITVKKIEQVIKNI